MEVVPRETEMTLQYWNLTYEQAVDFLAVYSLYVKHMTAPTDPRYALVPILDFSTLLQTCLDHAASDN